MFNKNFVISLLGATVIMFVYQAMSWMVLPIHTNSFKIAKQEDTVLTVLEGLEEGVYMMPGHSQDMSNEEMEQMDREMAGKPWAEVTYHKAWDSSMGGAMARGFLFNIISVCIVLWIMQKTAGRVKTFGDKFITITLLGVFMVFQINLMDWNWMHTPMHYVIPEIIDNILGWSLCGVFIAWYYKPE